jgi:hypothetical protein
MAQIRKYIRERLIAEFKGQDRGAAAKASRDSGISRAHITNVLSEKSSAGELVARQLAAYWGMSYAELEAVACGEATPRAVTEPSTSESGPSLDEIREMLRAEIRAEMRAALADRPAATKPPGRR